MKRIDCAIRKFSFNPSNYNILIVEDSKSSNQLIDITFSDVGYNCFNAFTLKEARELLAKQTIHYIMLDINLPDGHGSELIQELAHSTEKIFVLTGEIDTTFVHSSFEDGVIDFIAKGQYFTYKIAKITQTIKQLEENKLKTLLIIDKDRASKEELKNFLKNRNYNIELASDEQTALEILNKKIIDLIFVDTNLSNGSGIELLQKYEEQIIIKDNIPVMLTTNSSDPLIIRDGLKSGAIDIVKKPYLIEEIVLKVDLWIDYKSKEEEALCSAKLLEEYKDAVDASSIVSKADKNGLITYVNDKFCELSGYSTEELIGKNHNIVRHSDTPSDTFQEMWHTIKVLKKAWKGKIKNRKKDGTFYWVEALIKPIVDLNGEITEFIGLRHDITKTENYKKILKNTLDNTNKSLDENLHYITQYEEANNKFTAILKTDTENIITYVNEMFCKLSGYSLEELVGRDCQTLRHENHLKMDTCKNLKDSLIKNEHIHIIFTNVAKDGSLYFIDTIVYPVSDINGKIIEHLHLMHDISELTNLHQEIEDTQKEIVYKMGEIGESRSKETGNHVKRVAEYSRLLAQLYGLDDTQADTLFTASPMHDIGKVAIADTILKKPAKLTEDEFEIMKTHTTIGYSVLEGSTRSVLKAAAIVAHEHHEKYNGRGYPRGLKGDEIHIYGRITAIADVFDALGSDRCYKRAWEDERIFKLFKEEQGEHFDPILIELFFENLEQFLAIRDRFKD